MMIDLVTPNTLEELYQNEKTRYAGSIFGDIETVLEKHKPVLEFLLLNRSSFTPDAFIGSEKSFLQEGVEVKDKEFISAMRESTVYLDDFLRFQRDIAQFHYQALENETNNWGEVISELAKVSDGYSESEIDSFFTDQREKIEQSMDEMLEELRDGNISEHEFRVFQQVKSQYQNATQRQLLLHSFKERIHHANSLLENLTYIGDNQPRVGQYFVYYIRPHQNHLENKQSFDVDFNANTVFAVIGKITGEHMTTQEDGLISIPEYEFDVIAYDTDVLELYDQFWLLCRENERLSPIYQKDYDLYDENPLGQIETKFQESGNGPQWW